MKPQNAVLAMMSCACILFSPLAQPSQRPNSAPGPSPVSPLWVPGKFANIPFRMLFPPTLKSGARYPLVVFLHGSDESGSDNAAQIANGVENFARPEYRKEFSAFVVAPQCPNTDSWGGYLYYNRSTSTQEAVMGLIAELRSLLPIDANRIYLTGVSMGAIGTWDMLARYPKVFAAGLPVSGAGDPATAGVLVKTPIWAFHGSEDRNVAPQYDQDLYQAIHKKGGSLRYTEFPDAGHADIWEQVYTDKSVMRWLFAQHR